MITRANLLTEYPRIFQSILPKPLQQEEFDFIAENMDLADEDEDIGKLVDTFIEKLNQVVEKQETEGKSKPVDKQTAKVAKTIKEKKLKPEPKPKKQKPEIEQVAQLPIEVAFIKSFCLMNGKVKTKSQIYGFIKRLQKAIAERKIRKTSSYADAIEYIQNHLITIYNAMRSGTKTYEIPAAKLTELKKHCAMKWADHVVIIRAYINILNETKTGLKDKAKSLLSKIEKSEFSDDAKNAIATITKSLKDYLAGKTDAPTINEMALQGLYGLAGLNGLGELPAVPAGTTATDNKILSAADFKNASFDLMGFSGKWLQLIGNPATPFKMMVWGTGGSGKSTLAIEFARYLAGSLNKRVLYVANEEGAGATLHEKMTRLNAFHPNLFITKTLPARLIEYDFVFCDSANSMQMDLQNFERIAKLYPKLSWVLMFQTTKEGNFLGEKNWQHAVDVEVYVNDGKAKALKSRFGGKEEVGAW